MSKDNGRNFDTNLPAAVPVSESDGGLRSSDLTDMERGAFEAARLLGKDPVAAVASLRSGDAADPSSDLTDMERGAFEAARLLGKDPVAAASLRSSDAAELSVTEDTAIVPPSP